MTPTPDNLKALVAFVAAEVAQAQHDYDAARLAGFDQHIVRKAERLASLKQVAAAISAQPKASEGKASEGKAGGEDAARLDWLAHYGIAIRHDQHSNDQGWFLVGFTGVGLGAAADHKRFPTVRAAIDAAMTATLTALGADDVR